MMATHGLDTCAGFIWSIVVYHCMHALPIKDMLSYNKSDIFESLFQK